MKNIILLWASLLLLSLCSCEKENTENPIIEPEISNTDATVADFSSAAIDFGTNLFMESVRQSDDENENLLVSPLSVQTALDMLLTGTQERTFDEIRNTLKIDSLSYEDVRRLYGQFTSSLEPTAGNSRLNISNAMFYDPNRINVNDSYSDQLVSSFNAEAHSRNFSDANTLSEINQWAEDKTEGRIDKILDEIAAEDVLYLINALYFLGDWENAFSEKSTFAFDFILGTGSNVSTDFMNGRKLISATQNEDFIAVDLLFEGDEYSMTFLMPIDRRINYYLSQLGDDGFNNVYRNLYADLIPSDVVFSLPKFEVGNDLSLIQTLKAMGINDAFIRGVCNLDNMVPETGQLFVNKVKHNTFLKIDEKGAEGAAVTTVGVGATSIPPPLTFNNPFIYWIRHIESNAPIFIGKIENPQNN